MVRQSAELARWLTVQSSRVDHGTDGLLAEQNHQQITGHCSFVFLVHRSILLRYVYNIILIFSGQRDS